MYMTSALSKNDMKAIGLQMALDLLAKKEKRDSITGLRTRTQPGRPEWGKVRRCVGLTWSSSFLYWYFSRRVWDPSWIVLEGFGRVSSLGDMRSWT